jgi:hypothetical protein
MKHIAVLKSTTPVPILASIKFGEVMGVSYFAVPNCRKDARYPTVDSTVGYHGWIALFSENALVERASDDWHSGYR